MIKSLSYWSLPQGLDNTLPIADALAQAKAMGFAGLELAIAPTGVITPETDRAACERIRGELEASGLAVQTLASGMAWAANPVNDDPAVREQAIRWHAGALRVAGWLGLDALLMVPGVVRSPIVPEQRVRYDLAVDRARQAVDQLLPVAEEAGVSLCLENVWNGLFLSPLELAAFIDSFGHDRLGVYFDVGNVLGYHQDPAHWIQILAGRIQRVHIKDFQESVGTLEGFCDLLAGDVPWERTMAALREIGYDKTLVAEMVPPQPGQAQRAGDAMDKILKM